MKNENDMVITLPMIFDLYYERMALFTYMSPSCKKLMAQYTATHQEQVNSNIKTILSNKYDLKFILGLLPADRHSAISMMAFYMCITQNDEFAIFETIIKAYNKDSKKLKLVQIDCQALHTIYEAVAKTGDFVAAAQLFVSGALNTPTRAFFAAEAVIWCSKQENTDEIVNSVFAAAYYSLTFSKWQMKEKTNPVFFDYLMKTSVKKILPNNSIQAKFLQDNKFIKQYRGSQRPAYETAEYKEFVRIASTISTLASGGFMQEQQLSSITLNKEKVQHIAENVYGYCGFNEDTSSGFDEIAKALMDKKSDTIPPSKLSAFDSAVSTFEETLYQVVYLTAISEICKRNVLDALQDEFFNPQGEKAEKRLKSVERELQQAKSKNDDLKKQLRQMRAETDEANKQSIAVRNKWAGIQEKVDAQQVEIENLRKQLAEEKARNNDLEQQLSELTREDVQEVSVEPDAEPAIDYRERLNKIFASHKVVFVGGNYNIMSKFARRNPDAIIIPANRIGTSDQQVENADAILMKTDSMGHKEYYKYKQIAIRKGIPFSYLENRSNVELVEQDVFETLEIMGLTQTH